MTSQRDETTHHTAGEEMADDPIIIERRDETLTGDGPVDDGTGYDPGVGHGPGSARPGSDQAGYGRSAPGGGAGEDMTASDELVGRHVTPEDTGGMDPAPLVVPPEAARSDMGSPDMGSPAAGGPAAMPGAAASSAATPSAAGPSSVAPGSAPFGSPSPDLAAPYPEATSSAPDAVVQPGVAETPDPAVSGLASAGDRDPDAGATGGSIPAAALSEQQWPAIQAMFVDDPKGSVQRAAAAADEVMKAFVASLEREQAALRATWENDSTTENLRTALQQYRAFCGRLEGLA